MNQYYEEITRHYSNGVKITYEKIDDNNLYISTIINSSIKRNGCATESLKTLIDENSNKNIYIFASSELGINYKILNKWYEKIGFVKASNISNIPYNITHVLKARE